jgi:hypothetical protein
MTPAKSAATAISKNTVITTIDDELSAVLCASCTGT